MRAVFAIVVLAPLALFACEEECADTICPAGSTAGSGGATDGGGGAGATGGGGAPSGGGGTGGMPECMNDIDCTDAANAHCDAGSCVPCTTSEHCAGVVGLPACDAGSCVECLLGEEGACVAPQTCDLLAKSCVDVAPSSVLNCRACTNDNQCVAGHRCIPMEFEMAPHGHYCLEDAGSGCSKPFVVFINQVSLSGAAAVNYCGVDEDTVSCEAVNALLQDWRCSGTDGMCSPDGILPEQAVPGAICKQVGPLANRCTYPCAGVAECLSGGPGGTCGTGTQLPPGWCGG